VSPLDSLRYLGVLAVVAAAFLGLSVFAAVARGPVVVAIHPGADVVPENLLRFYIDFSEPMQGGDAFAHLRLVDKNGPVADAFRELELWSRGQRRLMVYIHPGRIKRGLTYATTMGPVLREGESFRLEIAAGMKSSSGRAGSGGAKSFRVGSADREMPDVAKWVCSAGGIEVDEWLDHAGLEEYVTVDGRGPTVRGRRLVLPLAPGEHVLVVDPHLEDLAGNSFVRRFETRPEETDRAGGVVERRFVVR